ncbi:MAG: ABC transporter transmembrane domain-containing protein [Phycisphaeraceae bacterium]
MSVEHKPERSTREDNSTLLRMALLIRPYALRLLAVMLMLIGLTAVNMLMPQLIRMVFERVFPDENVNPDGNLSLLWMILPALLVLYLLRNLLYSQSKYSAVVVGENVCFQLRNRLFDRLQQRNLHYYRRTQPGQLSSRVMNDSFVIQQFIQDQLPKLLQNALLFLGVVAIIYAMNWQLALASTIVLPLHLAAFHYFRRPIKAASRTAQEHLATAHGNLIEKFLGIEVVKGFTGEERETQAFQKAIDASRQSQLQSYRYHVTQKVMADLLVGLGTIFLLGFGAWHVVKGHLTGGAFLAFFFYIGMLYPAVTEIMGGFGKLTKAAAGVDRVFEVLGTSSQDSEAAEGGATPAIRGAIRFEGVHFRYDDGAPVLKNLTFSIPPGKVCAIVGPSGSGKSTLVSLVPRFNDPDGGRIWIDGTRLDQIDVRHLRQAIGIAFQECFLFNSSVLENLRYADPSASRQRIEAIAKDTGAHEFISRLPDGYDTHVGESGVSLSRGQKQQIALTRAMLKDPQILILDEATSSLDEAREARVVPAIMRFMKDKTTLMITHRPELLKHADLVLQINDGRLTYLGPPDQMVDPADQSDVHDHADLEIDELDQDDFGSRHRSRELSSSGSWGPVAVILAGLLGLAGLLAGPAQPAWAQDEKPKQQTQQPEQEKQAQQQKQQKQATEAEQAGPAAPAEPASSGQFIAQPDLSAIEVAELLDVAVARLQATRGYRQAAPGQFARMPAPPSKLRQVTHLVRESAQGVRLLQLGYRSFASQPPHVWIHGATLAESQHRANDDVAAATEAIEAARKQAGDYEHQPRELRSQRIKLSYINSGRCLGILKSLGYQIVEYNKGKDTIGKDQILAPSSNVDVKKLPAIVAVPGPDEVDLVGPAQTAEGGGRNIKVSMSPAAASELPESTTASPMMELLVFYDPARPEQFAEVLNRIQRDIDLPAQQLLIEAMVLEISETGLEKLGVEWELTRPFEHHENLDNVEKAELGQLPPVDSGESPTLRVSIADAFNHWQIELEALIQSGEAEVLSRPSVLTLDSRQASIRVGEEIPIARSIKGFSGGDNVQLDFDYIPVGILLNVRPRISDEADEVSLQIDAIVSAEVPGGDLVIRTEDGTVLGRAPRISTRRVQTYARLANNTPFIIGGLISKDSTIESDKVPLLGDLPLIKHAFRNKRANSLKREVIIVLTPYVLPEDQLVGRNLPKDEDAFDSFGNELFRDAYRIRSEDVFDLSFLTENRELRKMQDLARQVLRHNHDLGDQYPFRAFAGGRIPGEDILVHRQMYEVIKRKELHEQVPTDNIILFVPDEASQSSFGVDTLEERLQAAADQFGRPGRDPFKVLQGENKALALIYTGRADSGDAADILSQPVPEARVVDCPDGDAWSRLLWQLNQPDERGRERHTMLIQSREDITRLKLALLLKQTITLNASRGNLTLDNFTIGRQLLMPSVKTEQMHLMDLDAARCFFYTEQYYPALQQRLHRDTRALAETLEDPKYARYLDHPVEEVLEER